jgi:hypothetical protein
MTPSPTPTERTLGVNYYSFSNLREIGIPHCRQTVDMMVRNGRFPRPTRLLNGRLRWLKADVDAWLAGRNVERAQ